ncbi:hypothetical protein FB451DRAFT_1164740 [Mycena latifolia]|nr:hypothetical protein FB451DRAFT_1164740 [Mycena latifolia]
MQDNVRRTRVAGEMIPALDSQSNVMLIWDVLEQIGMIRQILFWHTTSENGSGPYIVVRVVQQNITSHKNAPEDSGSKKCDYDLDGQLDRHEPALLPTSLGVLRNLGLLRWSMPDGDLLVNSIGPLKLTSPGLHLQCGRRLPYDTYASRRRRVLIVGWWVGGPDASRGVVSTQDIAGPWVMYIVPLHLNNFALGVMMCDGVLGSGSPHIEYTLLRSGSAAGSINCLEMDDTRDFPGTGGEGTENITRREITGTGLIAPDFQDSQTITFS